MIERRYGTMQDEVDERQLHLSIQTSEPLPKDFFDDLQLLVNIHLKSTPIKTTISWRVLKNKN